MLRLMQRDFGWRVARVFPQSQDLRRRCVCYFASHGSCQRNVLVLFRCAVSDVGSALMATVVTLVVERLRGRLEVQGLWLQQPQGQDGMQEVLQGYHAILWAKHGVLGTLVLSCLAFMICHPSIFESQQFWLLFFIKAELFFTTIGAKTRYFFDQTITDAYFLFFFLIRCTEHHVAFVRL